ncbi:DUF1643 domain-containing protein [Vallitalea okinawensis]|uniref:DUF1643 domain-containing protein n=1 Tax=Vallitalea okinawensis TaxID=2078660 RepID=UPI000CFC2184|nr:DUF1643 domain-containing protein [Vallitalea okinawensis]
MPLVDKSTLKTEAYFTDDKSHRFLLRKEWNKNKPKATIVMINPSTADNLQIDHTTMFTINNLVKLDYGSVDIVNLFSKVGSKLSMKLKIEDLVHKDNDIHIEKSFARSDAIIIAWGSVGENSKKIKDRQKQIYKMLGQHKEKVFVISDSIGRTGFHPLAPQVRHEWKLEKFEVPKVKL